MEQATYLSNTQIAWRILNRRERRGLFVIFLLMLTGAVVEIFSIAIIIPVVAALSKPDYVAKFPFIDRFLGFPTDNEFVIWAMSFIVLVYIAKSFLLMFALWRQRSYGTAVTTRVGRQLFETYLRQPYAFHLQRNSSTLIRESQFTSSIMSTYIDPILTIVSDALITSGLVMTMLVVEPRGTLVTLALFGCSAALFQRVTSRRISRWGGAQKFHKGMLLKHLQQGFGGVKDVKILGQEANFTNEYYEHLIGNARVNQRFAIAQALPRFGLEVLAVFGLAVMVLTMALSNTKIDDILPVLGLFGATAFRLIPAVNRTINGLQNIKISRPFINDLCDDLSLGIPSSDLDGVASHLVHSVKIDSVSFKYESATDFAIVELDVEIFNGEAVGIIGPSGSGKSTLVDILLGLLEPTSGRVLVDGNDIRDNLRGWQDQIGYVPQSIFVTDDTLRRNVAFGLPKGEIDEVAVGAAIRSAQLEDFVASLPDGLDTIVGERGVRLSGGQRQRIGIARALYNNPDVLVLDEATSSLDTDTEHGVMQAVQALQGEKTVIIVAHRLSTVEYCDRLYRLENARIVDEGTFSEVTSRAKDLPREN